MTSVAICTWNRCELLRTTLGHMTAMQVPAALDWELLVVNNNGTDQTDAVCESFKGRLPIRLLQEPTPGQSFARNLAIREARGRYLAWTDDDVIVASDWLTEIDKAFARHGADFVFGPSEPEWPSDAPTWYSPRFRGKFAVLDYGTEAFVSTDPLKPFYGLNFAGSTATFRSLGGFRTEYGLKGNAGGVGEDVEMYERAFRAGLKIVYVPSIRVRHMIDPERVFKKYHRRRQRVALPVYFRHMDEVFPSSNWLGGLPRFFYSRFLGDLGGWTRAAMARDASERFHYELQLLRFTGLIAEAAKHGFRRPARTSAAKDASAGSSHS